MTNTPPYSFCAGAAIAAVLALGSTPTLAQEAVPVIDVPPAVQAAPPVTAPDAAPAPTVAPATPTIVRPPEITAPQPTVEAPAASAPAEQASTARPTRAQAQPSTAARTNSTPPAAETTPVAEAPVAVPSAVLPMDNPVTLSGAVSEPVAVEEPNPVAEPAGTQDNSALLSGLMAGLVILGAGAAFALRRKRRVVSEPEDRELAAGAPAYDAGYASVVVPELAMTPAIEPGRAEVHAEPSRVAAPAVGWMEAAPNAGVDFAMPAGPVPTGEAREELLRRMIAAAPDAANPFRSTVARRKRARIILQTREHQQKQDATRPFDFRTYQSPQPSAATTRETESADA